MNDNQRKLTLGINLIDGLIEAVEQKKITVEQMLEIIKELRTKIQDIDFPLQTKVKIEEILKRYNLTVELEKEL
jgi:hypothetical protein